MSFHKFYFRDFRRHLFQHYFRSNIAISKTSFLGAPFQDRPRQTDCLTVLCSQEARFGSTYDCVPDQRMLKNRMAALITTEKRLQVLKATQIFVSFFSCFNGYLIFLCFRFSA